MPPPSVNPPIPVEETRPPVVARPCAWVSWSNCRQVAPPCASARRLRGSTRTAAIAERSSTTPPSQVENPATLCAPPRIATGSPSLQANWTPLMTSATPEQRRTSAGCMSIAPFQILRAFS